MNETAKTGLQALGSTGRLKAMLGAKDFLYCDKEDSFSFKFKLCKKHNCFKMAYDAGMDLFNIEFGKISNKKDKMLGIMMPEFNVTKELSGVYADQLREIFESETGLHLSF